MSTDIDQVLNKFGLDRARVKDAGAFAMPIMDTVLDHFYDFATSDSDTMQFFPQRAVMDHARREQKRHWELLFTGQFDEVYLASADRLGRVHFKIQLPFLLYLSGYTHATSRIQTLLLKETQGVRGLTQAGGIRRALPILTRAFGLDMHFVIDAYFAAQAEEQNIAFQHIKDGIARMAAKDLSHPIPDPAHSNFPVRYDDIRASFNVLMGELKEVIETIQETTEELDRRAQELTAAAQDLSGRTETQAAALEQTAAAVEEINGNVRTSASATAETDQVVAQTQQNAQRGNKVVQESVKMMRDIAASSAQISQIITLIDDIAFQTNLLALNAGVEAARAGEAGRGFAFVASEVRGLAQRASESAKEIGGLIQNSSSLVETGVQLADQAGDALNNIVNDVDRAAVLMSQVTNASKEQATGLAEIASGVAQLDNVTQHNAAMAEETAAAIASMQQDTRTLAALVDAFVLADEVPAWPASAVA